MRVLSLLLCFCLVFNYSVLAQVAGPQTNVSGQVLNQKPAIFTPLHLRYISYNQIEDNFNIILDKGNFAQPNASELQENAKPLLNYFFIGINLPSDSFWVNLRPDSEDKIIDPLLGKTDIGKILLEADLQLKKDIAQATSPQTPTGKEYWDKLYKKIDQTFGKTDVAIPTLTRPWIVPDEVIVRETEESAYVYKATLKVMLEGDYLAGSQVYNFKDERLRKLNEYSAQLIKELVIPALNKEINSSQRYAALRQVYYSLILSQWFKARFAGQAGQYASLIDKKDLSGLTSAKPWDKALYFKDYQKSFNEREYNLKESVNAMYGRSVKSYYSGGIFLKDMFVRPVTPVVAGMPAPTTRMPTQTQLPPRPGMPAAQLPPTTRIPAAQPQIPVTRLTGAEATRVVIPATAGLGLNYDYATAPVTDTSVVAIVSGRPDVGLRVTLALPAAERQFPVQERRVRGIQRLANVQTEIISGAAPAALAPAGPAGNFAPRQERGAMLGQLLAARSPQVYTVEGIPFIPVTGLGGIQLELGKTFGQPVVYISAELAGNDKTVAERYGVAIIKGLDNEARNGRIPGARTLPALSTLMGQNPQVVLPALARVDKQVRANAGTDITQIVPGHNAYGFGELANPAVGLPQMNIPLAGALEIMQTAPVPVARAYMARVTDIGNRALGRVQQLGVTPRSPAVQVLVAIVSQPVSQRLLSLGPERAQAVAARAGEEFVAFVNLLSQAQQTLANVPGIPTQVLNPRPALSARLERDQASLIPRDIIAPATPAAPATPVARGLVNLEVMTPAGPVTLSLEVQVLPGGGLQANVLPGPGELNRPTAPTPVNLQPGRLVRFAAERAPAQEAAPAAPVVPGALRLAPLAEGQVTSPGGLVLGLELTPQGLSVSNIAQQAGTSVEVTAFRPTTTMVEGVLVQAPALPMGAVTAPRVEGLGGIDLRVLPIVTQPLSNLSANLNKSTLRSLRNRDLDKEWEAIEKMIQAGIIPSAERIKEGIQASCLQGEISLDIDRIVLDISQIFKIEEARYAATEPALRDILVVLGAASSPAEISQVFLGKI